MKTEAVRTTLPPFDDQRGFAAWRRALPRPLEVWDWGGEDTQVPILVRLFPSFLCVVFIKLIIASEFMKTKKKFQAELVSRCECAKNNPPAGSFGKQQHPKRRASAVVKRSNLT